MMALVFEGVENNVEKGKKILSPQAILSLVVKISHNVCKGLIVPVDFIICQLITISKVLSNYNMSLYYYNTL